MRYPKETHAMSTPTVIYEQVPADQVPDHAVWWTARADAGQAVTHAYATGEPGAKTPASRGDRFQKVTDRSCGEVTFWRLVP